MTVSGDAAFEPDERFTLSLSNPGDATIADASATGTIVNDDETRTTITLKVAKLRRTVRASGVLEPTGAGHRVTVTLFRKRGARFAKIASKTVRVKALRDRDGDGRPDGAYAASFRRPTEGGRFKVTARFGPRPGYLGSSRSRAFSLGPRR